MTIMTSNQNEPETPEFDAIGNPWMSRILPNLYLGSRIASRNNHYLQAHEISHMVTIGRSYIDVTGVLRGHEGPDTLSFLDTNTGIQRLLIPLRGIETEDFMQYFPAVIGFIRDALANDGIVLVQCNAGYSRSATFVAAFLMKTWNLSMEDALAWIEERRHVNPRSAYREQLMLLQRCGPDPNYHLLWFESRVRRYKMRYPWLSS
jgi:hypothetical protein